MPLSKKILFQDIAECFNNSNMVTYGQDGDSSSGITKREVSTGIPAAAYASISLQFRDVGSQKLNHPSVSNETYGRDSRIYLQCANSVDAHELAGLLQARGHKVHRDYGVPNVVEVSVSYFKGHHWDE